MRKLIEITTNTNLYMILRAFLSLMSSFLRHKVRRKGATNTRVKNTPLAISPVKWLLVTLYAFLAIAENPGPPQKLISVELSSPCIYCDLLNRIALCAPSYGFISHYSPHSTCINVCVYKLLRDFLFLRFFLSFPKSSSNNY